MAAPSDDDARPSPLALGLAAVVVALAIAAIPLIPEAVRPWNFAAFGAVALFVAARGGRYGVVAAVALTLGAKLASDLLNYANRGFDDEYLPFTAPIFGLTVYAGLAVYAVLGRGLRRTANPLLIGAAAVAGSVVFFLLTNFGSWVHQDLPYPQTPVGLLESYWMGLPFFRGTLAGDLTFTGVLFAAHAVLVRATAPALVPVPVRVTTGADR